MKKLFLDFETFCEVDIAKAGVYKYTEDDTFRPLLAGYKTENIKEVVIVDLRHEQHKRAFLTMTKKFLAEPGSMIFAHNAQFERLTYKAMGLDIPAERFFCTSNQASYCGLPGSLGELSKVLNLTDGKMTEGKKLIKLFCMPNKTKHGMVVNQAEDFPAEWDVFREYLKYDVLSEIEVFEKLKQYGFPKMEQAIYALDQEINDRGILVDNELALAALNLDKEYKAELEAQILEKHGVNNLRSGMELINFVKRNTGITVKSLTKADIPVIKANTMATGIPEKAKKAVCEVLDARAEIGKTSNAKYGAIQTCIAKSGRVKGLFRYYGASRTGRWAGRLVQLQNLPQNHIEDLDEARGYVKLGNLKEMQKRYEKPTHILSQLIRTAFVAPEGKTFAVSDFSAIEARVIAWVTHEQWRLDLFKSPNSDIYCASASKMFNKEVKKGDSERQQGKIAELALGYGGSVNALTIMDSKGAIPEEEKPIIVSKWRSANKHIVGFWKQIETLCKDVISGKFAARYVIAPKAFIDITFNPSNGMLRIKLPSGRTLNYPNARVEMRTVGKGMNAFQTEQIVYNGKNQVTGKWCDLSTYGGKLTENIVQAIARDILASAMFNVRELGHPIVMHVHDEIVAEVNIEGAEETMLKMSDAMCILPEWAEGLPLNAAGYVTPYYKKD